MNIDFEYEGYGFDFVKMKEFGEYEGISNICIQANNRVYYFNIYDNAWSRYRYDIEQAVLKAYNNWLFNQAMSEMLYEEK